MSLGIVSLCTAGCGSTIVCSLFARAIALEVIDFALLLLKCFGHICFEEVVLNLHLLGCVRDLLDGSFVVFVDFLLFVCELDCSFQTKGWCESCMEGILDTHGGCLDESCSEEYQVGACPGDEG